MTPDFTGSLSPSYFWSLPGGGLLTARLDYYHRSEMFGQPINSQLNRMAALNLVNISLGYESPSRGWTLSLYGQNLTDETYPLAKLDLDPTVLVINSNDRREYGVRFGRRFPSPSG